MLSAWFTLVDCPTQLILYICICQLYFITNIKVTNIERNTAGKSARFTQPRLVVFRRPVVLPGDTKILEDGGWRADKRK